MCEALGYEVFKLRRVRIMNISLDGIPNGKWRYLTDDEVTKPLTLNCLTAVRKIKPLLHVATKNSGLSKATMPMSFVMRQIQKKRSKESSRMAINRVLKNQSAKSTFFDHHTVSRIKCHSPKELRL